MVEFSSQGTVDNSYAHPGEQLKRTRESLSLSREEVASRLNLEPRIIQYLEEGQFDKLPGKIFVTGYIRSYARLIDLPADELLGQFNDDDRQSDLLPRNVDYAETDKLTGRRRPNLLLPLLAAVVLIAGIALIIWFSQGEDADSPLVQLDAEPVVTAAQPGDTADAPAENEPATTATEEGNDAVVMDSASPEAAVQPTAAVESDEQVSPQSPQTEKPEVTTAPAEPVAGQAVLKITYDAPSWTEITDATGQQLVYRLVGHSQELEVSGKPPFKIFFGYAPGVRLKYQGSDVDITRFTRGDLAQFTIGKQ